MSHAHLVGLALGEGIVVLVALAAYLLRRRENA